MAKIAIVGAGMMGSALAFPAAENGHEVSLIGTHLDKDIIDECRKTGRHPKFEKDFPNGVRYFKIEELTVALEGADAVILGVSSFGVEWFREYVLPRLIDGTIVLSVTKGLLCGEDGSLTCYPEYWEKAAAGIGKTISFNAVGGPCTSYELVAHDHTEVAFCGRQEKDLLFLKHLLETDYYHISVTKDVRGLEAAVALKNGYALGIALTVGLNQKVFGKDSALHYNSQAGVFYESVKEMKKLLDRFGASENSFFFGAGDLYVTVYGGRTRLVGILLGRGLTIDEAQRELSGVTLESLVVARRVAKAMKTLAAMGKVNLNEFPLLMHIDGILEKKNSADLPWKAFSYNDFTR